MAVSKGTAGGRGHSARGHSGHKDAGKKTHGTKATKGMGKHDPLESHATKKHAGKHTKLSGGKVPSGGKGGKGVGRKAQPGRSHNAGKRMGRR